MSESPSDGNPSNESNSDLAEVIFDDDTEEALKEVGLELPSQSLNTSQFVQRLSLGSDSNPQAIALAQQQYEAALRGQQNAIVNMMEAISSSHPAANHHITSTIPTPNMNMNVQQCQMAQLQPQRVQPSTLPNPQVGASAPIQSNDVNQQALLSQQHHPFQSAQQHFIAPNPTQENPAGYQLTPVDVFGSPSMQPNQQLHDQQRQLQILQQLLLSANTVVDRQRATTAELKLPGQLPPIPPRGPSGNLYPSTMVPTTFSSSPTSPSSFQLFGGYSSLHAPPAATSSTVGRTKPGRTVKPKRPLSAYNIFFKEERARILRSIPDKRKREKVSEADEDIFYREDPKESTEGILDPTGPLGTSASSRSMRKKRPHGKMSFEDLAREVGQRWKNLDEGRRDYYKKLAANDLKRYKVQMEEFTKVQRSENERKMKNMYGLGSGSQKEP